MLAKCFSFFILPVSLMTITSRPFLPQCCTSNVLFVTFRSGLPSSMDSLVRFCLSAGASACTMWWVFIWFTLLSPLLWKSLFYNSPPLLLSGKKTNLLWHPRRVPLTAGPYHHILRHFPIIYDLLLSPYSPRAPNYVLNVERTTALHAPKECS